LTQNIGVGERDAERGVEDSRFVFAVTMPWEEFLK
jgi:hypothetical protein